MPRPPIATPPQRHETEADRLARANEEAIQQAIAEVESENQMLQMAVHSDRFGNGVANAMPEDSPNIYHHLNESRSQDQGVLPFLQEDRNSGLVVEGVPLTGPHPPESSHSTGGNDNQMRFFQNWDEDKKVASNSIQLLLDILAGDASHGAIDPNDDLIQDLVGQCKQMQPQIIHLVETSQDENVLMEALQLNDDIGKALEKFKDLVSKGAQPRMSPSSGSVGYIPPSVAHAQDPYCISNLDVVAELTPNSAPPAQQIQAQPALPAPPAQAAPIFDLLSGDPLPPPSSSVVTGGPVSESSSNPFLMLAAPQPDPVGQTGESESRIIQKEDPFAIPVAASKTSQGQDGNSGTLSFNNALFDIAPRNENGESNLDKSSTTSNPFDNFMKTRQQDSNTSPQSQSLLRSNEDSAVDDFWRSQLAVDLTPSTRPPQMTGESMNERRRSSSNARADAFTL